MHQLETDQSVGKKAYVSV